MQRSEHIALFVAEIWAWYARHKRVLPWRDLEVSDPTQRAYLVLVSEIMLQQTQVPRVIVIFKRFTEEFPTLQALANASNADVIRAWKGMGYNSRALRLRDAAKTILERFEGRFPSDEDALLGIKGIGAYTAGAIRNFAFGIPTPCMDTNIRRILHRTFIGPENPDGSWKKDDGYLMHIAAEVLVSALNVRNSTADWHAALMDYGSLVQTKRNPKWDICALTQKGLMKAAHKVPKSVKKTKIEPGRLVGSVFVPNRIFRGRIVDQLRDHPAGLAVPEIGKRISVDWNTKEHSEWLEGLLKKLTIDRLLMQRGARYLLSA